VFGADEGNRTLVFDLEVGHCMSDTRGIGPEHRAFRASPPLLVCAGISLGCFAFAYYVEPVFAKRCYDRFNSIVWSD
jgi:hypothetical protein